MDIEIIFKIVIIIIIKIIKIIWCKISVYTICNCCYSSYGTDYCKNNKHPFTALIFFFLFFLLVEKFTKLAGCN